MRLKLGPFLLYSHHLGDYARRWILQHPLGTIRIHHLMRSDADPEIHDHPWAFVSLLLAGAYYEELPHGSGPVRRRLSVLRRRAEDRHRVVIVRPAWTLVFSGPKRRSWGFWRGETFIPWREFVSAKERFSLAEYAAGLPGGPKDAA